MRMKTQSILLSVNDATKHFKIQFGLNDTFSLCSLALNMKICLCSQTGVQSIHL